MKFSKRIGGTIIYIEDLYGGEFLTVKVDGPEKLLARLKNGCSGQRSMTLRAVRVWWLFLTIGLGSTVKRRCDFAVTRKWCHVFGCSNVCLATLVISWVKLWYSSLLTACSVFCDMVCDVRVSYKIRICVSTATAFKCQKITLCSTGKIPPLR